MENALFVMEDRSNPDVVDAKLGELSRCQSALDVEIGEWLLAAERIDLHVKFGYASILEYAHRRFGWDGRHTYERLRVARKLEVLPATRDQLLGGRIVWSVAREISRIVETPEVEAEWLLAAEGRTAREVEKMVANRPRGARPSDPADPRLETTVVRLRFTAEKLARYQQVIAAERARTGDPKMSEEDAVISAFSFSDAVPGADAGVGGNQLAFVRKIGAEQTWVQTRDGEKLVSAEVAERIECDATIVPPTVDGVVVEKASQTIPPSIRRQVIAESGGRCETPGCTKCNIDVHHSKFRSEGGTHELKKLIALCWWHHTRVHDGFLRIEGDRDVGFRFQHADGKPYGTPGTPVMLQSIADAYHGLRRLGYRDADARNAAEAASAELVAAGKPAASEAIVERAIRAAGRTRTYVMQTDAAATTAPVGTNANAPATAHVGTTTNAPSRVPASASVMSDAETDAFSGLRNLGYRDAEARAAIRAASESLDSPATAEAIVGAVLRARGGVLLARETGPAYGAGKPRVAFAHVGTNPATTVDPGTVSSEAEAEYVIRRSAHVGNRVRPFRPGSRPGSAASRRAALLALGNRIERRATTLAIPRI